MDGHAERRRRAADCGGSPSATGRTASARRSAAPAGTARTASSGCRRRRCGRRGRTRSGRAAGPTVMPCRPSAPPVQCRQGVGDLVQHQRDAERHHQAREVAAAQHQEAGERSRAPPPTAMATSRPAADRGVTSLQQACRRHRRRRRRTRHGPARRCRHSRGSDRARARTGRGSRSRSAAGACPPAAKQRGERDQPEDDLGPAPAGAPREARAALTRPHRARANRPCGRSTSTTIITT